MSKIKIEHLPLDRLIPYAKNSRTHSEEQVAQIAASIREFGFTNPILIDAENGIIAGHGRVLAARKLSLDQVPCIRLAHLTETQRRAYVIADNQIALNAGWNEELLAIELSTLREEGFDLNLTGFDGDSIEAFLNPDEPAVSDDYTTKVDAPVYEPKGEKPPIQELIDDGKARDLLAKVESAKIPPEIKVFLKQAATRHLVFDYGKIAEFYCHADKLTQELMEDLALIIIDYKKALQLGYVKLKAEIAEALEGETSTDANDDDE